MNPFLIVGHTTASSTVVWICGTRDLRSATVTLRDCERGTGFAPQKRELGPRTDYTARCDFTELEPGTEYEVSVRFHRRRGLLGLLFGRPEEPPTKGRLRTFPLESSSAPFSFLHGSCNLSTVRLTHLGGLAAGGLGMLMVRESLERDSSYYDWGLLQWTHPLVRNVLSRLLLPAFKFFFCVTRFELPSPLLPSPFQQLVGSDSGEGPPGAPRLQEQPPPSFAIHAGDQIYFDFPFPGRKVHAKEYRRAYREAWSEDRFMREFLARCPHYMIWDDHEIVDQFANDSIPAWAAERKSKKEGRPPEIRTPAQYLDAARAAYRDYVDARNPSAVGELFYEFRHGRTGFFVLDTRSDRHRRKGEMIGSEQMRRLKVWLVEDPDDLKFVVSSIPFVAQLRRRAHARGNDGGTGRPRALEEEAPDKWSSEPYRRQRDEIVEFLHENGIGRVVFLVGDMHCTYHASMRVGAPGRRITVHELASGPIHQLQFASRDDFHAQYRGATLYEKNIPFAVSMGFIHGATGNMMRVTARPENARVGWEVVPTCSSPTRPEYGDERNESDTAVSVPGVDRDAALPLRGTIHLGVFP